MSKLKSMQCCATFALLLAATSARAQAPALPVIPTAPPAAVTAPPAVTQNTERAAGVRPPTDNRIMANLSAGTTLNGGNTQAYGASFGGRFQLNRHLHQFTADALLNWAKAYNAATDSVEPTSLNLIGKARYDYFVAQKDALFAAVAPRHDKFAGLDMRLQMQGGYLRNLYVPADNHRLWIEAGYDATYDNFSPFVPAGVPDPMIDLPKDAWVHSARGFLGYTNLLTPLCTLNVGVEVLYDLLDTQNARVNTVAELTSSLSQRFKLSILSRILYDQTPVEGKDTTDYITSAQLVYTFDTFTPPPPCPACDCSKEVAATKASCQSAHSASPADEPVLSPQEPGAPPAPLPAQPIGPGTQPAAPLKPAPQPPR